MFSKSSLEGELIIDHRAGMGTENTGITDMPVRSGAMLETSTITCSHCQKIVVKNPYRQRDRNYCRSCDKYICDDCSLRMKLSGECKSFKKFADEYLNNAALGKDSLNVNLTKEQYG